MKRPGYLVIALLFGAALIASVLVFWRYLPYTGVPLAPKQPPPIVLAMEDAYLVGLGHGAKLWSVKAKKIEIGQNRSSTTITGIEDGRIYDRGKVALNVKAGRADYDVLTRNLTLSKGIFIQGLAGQSVRADGATWNSFASTLRSSGRVSFVSGSSSMVADSLVVNLRKREMEMWNVCMRMPVKEIPGPPGD